MTGEVWVALVALAFSLAGTIAWAGMRWGALDKEIEYIKESLGAGHDCKEDIAELRSRIDTITGIFVHRSLVAAVQAGVAHMNSPVSITPSAREYVKPIEAALQKRYEEAWNSMTDAELMMAVEKEFGGWIYQHVCIPMRFQSGEGIVIAAVVAGRESLVGPKSTAFEDGGPEGHLKK